MAPLTEPVKTDFEEKPTKRMNVTHIIFLHVMQNLF